VMLPVMPGPGPPKIASAGLPAQNVIKPIDAMKTAASRRIAKASTSGQ
jgi:hypothetical protein